MITGVVTCPLCGDEQANSETFLDHVGKTHVRTLTPPDARVIKTQIATDTVTYAGDEDEVNAVVDNAMFHVEHLIASEWGPVTQGARLDTPVTDGVSSEFTTLTGALALTILDRLLAVLGDQAGNLVTSPRMLRWELKVSPLWQAPTDLPS